MGLIKEPKNIELTVQSSPWKKSEMNELSAIIKKAKDAKTRRVKAKIKAGSTKKHWA